MTNSNKIRYIEISAIDGLFFGSGLNSAMGEANVLKGVFPPLPTSFYGLIRDIFIDRLNVKKEDLNKKEDETLNLEIKGIYLLTEEGNAKTFLVPKPNNFVFEKGKTECNESFTDSFYPLVEGKDNLLKDCFSSNPFEKLFTFKKIAENPEGFYISTRYFDGKLTNYHFNLYKNTSNEAHVGLKRNRDTKTAEEGHLYSIIYNKPNNYRFLIAFSYNGQGTEKEDFDTGIKTFGANGKMVHYRILEKCSIPWPETKNLSSKKFSLTLLTPAVFAQGWLPSFLKNTTNYHKCPLLGVNVKLINALVGKEINVSGFDIKTGNPKVRRLAVPAGSVYYFETNDEKHNIKTGLQDFAFTDEFDDSISYKQQGFGVCYINEL